MAEPDSAVWTRLHPVTVIRELLSLVWNFVIAVFVSRNFGGVSDLEGPRVFGLSVGIEDVLAVVFLGFGVVRYLATSYSVTDQAVAFRRGVFVRTRTVLPRERIQNVAIGADLVGRIFGMQTLTVSSAGSDGEIELAVVSKSVAQALSAELTNEVVSEAPNATCDSITPRHEPLRSWYQLSRADFVRYGLTSNAIAFAVALLAVAAISILVFQESVFLLGGIGLIAPVVIVLDLFGFQASTDGDRVRVEHGMFSTREKWARVERIQLGDVRRPWLRDRIGYESLAIATADVTESANGQFDYCAPMVPTDSWRRRFATIGLASELDEEALVKVSPISIRRRTIRSSVFPVVALASIVGVGRPPITMASMAAMAIPMIVMMSWMLAKRSYRVDGWALGRTHLLVRRGRFNQRLLLVRLEKVQSVEIRSSFFQRRLGLASIAVDTANLGVTTRIPDLERTEAERLSYALMIAANTTVLPDGV